MKTAAAIACVAFVAAVGLDAQQQVPQVARQRNKAAITVEAVLLAADRIRADRWYPESTVFEGARALNRAADMDLLVTASNAEFISRYLEDDDPGVRIDTVLGWVKPIVADNLRSNPVILAPLPGNRIQSIVKCPER